MKKTTKISMVMLSVFVLSAFAVLPAFAADAAYGGQGNGGFGGQGQTGTTTGVPVQQSINLDGALEDVFHASLATALGITPEELTDRLDAGETFYEIALSLGFDATEISSIMIQARLDRLAQAVADGIITQDQADWLTSRWSRAPMAGVDGATCTLDGNNQSMMRNKGRMAPAD